MYYSKQELMVHEDLRGSVRWGSANTTACLSCKVSLKDDAYNAWQLLLIKTPDCSALQRKPNHVLAGA